MIFITKEDGDRLLEDFLVQLSKDNSSPRCAKESLKIIDNFEDSQIVVSILLTNIMLDKGLIPKHFIDFESELLSAICAFYSSIDKSEIPIQLRYLFDGNQQEIIDNFIKNRKMIFAIQQFVNAYYRFEIFENKYPEISKKI